MNDKADSQSSRRKDAGLAELKLGRQTKKLVSLRSQNVKLLSAGLIILIFAFFAHAEPISLKKDRSELKELREKITPEVQNRNDELAWLDDLFAGEGTSPNMIRSKFHAKVSKVRARFNEILKVERQEHQRQSTEKRKKYKEQQEKEKAEFFSLKKDFKERKSFLEKQNLELKEQYNKWTLENKEFDLQIKEKRNNQDDYLKGKTSEFNDRLKEFTEKQKVNKNPAIQKNKIDSKPSGENERNPKENNENIKFEEIRKKSPVILSPDGN